VEAVRGVSPRAASDCRYSPIAAGVTSFLSVTNIITYEITPAPLFWVIPLCLYLLSFVLVFKENPWYPAWISRKFHLVIGFAMLFYFEFNSDKEVVTYDNVE
jgi:hypothetical protein